MPAIVLFVAPTSNGRAIGRRVLAIVAAMIVANAVMFALESVGHRLYPPPSSLDIGDRVAMAAWIASLPAGAYALLLAGYALGSLSGGAIATAVDGRTTLAPAIVVGALVTIGGALNLVAIRHPRWLALASVLVYVPFACVGALWVRRTRVNVA